MKAIRRKALDSGSAPRAISRPIACRRSDQGTRLANPRRERELDRPWRSDLFGSADNSRVARMRSYGRLNVRHTVRCRAGNLRLTLSSWLNNVLDKRDLPGDLEVACRLNNYTMPELPRPSVAMPPVDL